MSYDIVIIYRCRALRTGKIEHKAMYCYIWRRYLEESGWL